MHKVVLFLVTGLLAGILSFELTQSMWMNDSSIKKELCEEENHESAEDDSQEEREALQEDDAEINNGIFHNTQVTNGVQFTYCFAIKSACLTILIPPPRDRNKTT